VAPRAFKFVVPMLGFFVTLALRFAPCLARAAHEIEAAHIAGSLGSGVVIAETPLSLSMTPGGGQSIPGGRHSGSRAGIQQKRGELIVRIFGCKQESVRSFGRRRTVRGAPRAPPRLIGRDSFRLAPISRMF